MKCEVEDIGRSGPHVPVRRRKGPSGKHYLGMLDMSKEEEDKFKQQILSLAEAYLDMYIPVTHQGGQWKLFLVEVLKQFPQELEKFKDAAPVRNYISRLLYARYSQRMRREERTGSVSPVKVKRSRHIPSTSKDATHTRESSVESYPQLGGSEHDDHEDKSVGSSTSRVVHAEDDQRMHPLMPKKNRAYVLLESSHSGVRRGNLTRAAKNAPCSGQPQSYNPAANRPDAQAGAMAASTSMIQPVCSMAPHSNEHEGLAGIGRSMAANAGSPKFVIDVDAKDWSIMTFLHQLSPDLAHLWPVLQAVGIRTSNDLDAIRKWDHVRITEFVQSMRREHPGMSLFESEVLKFGLQGLP